MMRLSVVLYFAILLSGSLAQRPSKDDPLCVERGCPVGTFCRVVNVCSISQTCNLTALCLDSSIEGSHRGVCRVGHPILERREGQLQDLGCGPTIPCPNGTYCNTELMDTYASCCRINTDLVIKPGACPPPLDDDDDYCVDECGNDGDCNWDDKCCNTGCKKQCVMPDEDCTTNATLCLTSIFLPTSGNDPLCMKRSCPTGTFCRVVKGYCSTPVNCNLNAICLNKRLADSHRGVCKVGHPILDRRYGQLQDLRCGPGSLCPRGTYCNTQLMDTYATCCRIHGDHVVKLGECPAPDLDGGDYCVDGCGNDGDCDWDYKCCHTGCSKQCIKPADPCENKNCPDNTYCLTNIMPPCPSLDKCYKVGDCVPCLKLSCTQRCEHGSILDLSGCPTCNCLSPLPKFPPRFPPRFPRIIVKVTRPNESPGEQ